MWTATYLSWFSYFIHTLFQNLLLLEKLSFALEFSYFCYLMLLFLPVIDKLHVQVSCSGHFPGLEPMWENKRKMSKCPASHWRCRVSNKVRTQNRKNTNNSWWKRGGVHTGDRDKDTKWDSGACGDETRRWCWCAVNRVTWCPASCMLFSVATPPLNVP